MDIIVTKLDEENEPNNSDQEANSNPKMVQILS